MTTSDGREINFLLELDYQRQFTSEQVNQFIGERNLIDPLMINVNGGPVALSDIAFEFDINADGQTDRIFQTEQGTGFLAFDKNANGTIDDGTELFGPQSGSGYWELAQLDSDNNGWIDENDADYANLSFMTLSANGQQLQSLTEAGIGAIYLGSTEFNMDLFTREGDFQGQTQRSGFALSEQGAVLHVQDMHFSTGQELNLVPANAFSTINAFTTLESFQVNIGIINERNQDTLVSIGGVNSFENAISGRNTWNDNFALSYQTIRYDETTGFAFFDWAIPGTDLAQNGSKLLESNQSIAARMMAKIDQNQSNRQASLAPDYKPPEANEFRFLDNLPGKINLDVDESDQTIMELRMVIDELKRMHIQQKENIKKLDVYQKVSKFD